MKMKRAKLKKETKTSKYYFLKYEKFWDINKKFWDVLGYYFQNNACTIYVNNNLLGRCEENANDR